MNNEKSGVIRSIQDDDYQERFSQISRARMNLNDWPKWFWGTDSSGNLYCKGMISGYSYGNRWTPG